MKNVTESRRQRIFAIKQTVPSIVWAVLLLGAALFIGCTYFFTMKNALPQYLITACFTILITLMLFLIYVLDHAFTGSNAISNEPLKFIARVMESRLGR
jgi:peptidoglycan/LPS O-acetylase OafA/YrhL